MATSYDIVTDVKRQELQDNYAIFINGHGNVHAAFSQLNITSPFLGYKVTYSDYIGIVSNVGVETWLVRFGYDHETTNGPKFCLLITGIDQFENVVSPNYKLISPIDQTFADGTKSKKSNNLVNEVPGPLVNPWLQAWEHLMEYENVPKDICQTGYGLLQGYNFHTNDFMGVLEGIFASTALDNEVDFFMANHAQVASPSSDQPSLPGTVGLMMALSEPFIANQNFDRLVVSSFYDLTAPCPPTCPDFKNK